MKLELLVKEIDATLEGDGDLEITGIAGLKEAGEGDISFLSNPKYGGLVPASRATAIVVRDDWEGECGCALLRVRNPDQAMAIVAPLLGPATTPLCEPGIHESAVVKDREGLDPSVSIGPLCVVEKGAVIGPRTVLVAGCYVGRDAVIGADCVLHAQAKIRERVTVGDRVILHDGAVVGGDGFGNYRENGQWRKIPHIGTVEIGDDSEIGVNSTVDRARFGKTTIGRGVKIDNLVMVGHNVCIGDHTAIAAQTGIAGSTTIGHSVMLGGQVGVAGHLKVGNGASAGAQAGVTKDVPEATYVTGYPAMPHRKAAEKHANLMRLKAWKEKIKVLETRIAAMESAAE